MNFFFLVLFFLASLFGSFSASDANARDRERQTDINNMHSQLELFYVDNGYYPGAETFEKEGVRLFRRLSELSDESFVDPSGRRINTDGDYSYVARDCVAERCGSYTLLAKLETGADFSKLSLN